jgi:hypothetical protein
MSSSASEIQLLIYAMPEQIALIKSLLKHRQYLVKNRRLSRFLPVESLISAEHLVRQAGGSGIRSGFVCPWHESA